MSTTFQDRIKSCGRVHTFGVKKTSDAEIPFGDAESHLQVLSVVLRAGSSEIH